MKIEQASITVDVWHKRYGHLNEQVLQKLKGENMVTGLNIDSFKLSFCKPEQERIIAFASKSLSHVEKRYANIEREKPSVVFGIERFHAYIFGARVIIESVHKPLESISIKDLAEARPRLQCMLLRMQPYDVKIKYQFGAGMQIADVLSRY